MEEAELSNLESTPYAPYVKAGLNGEAYVGYVFSKTEPERHYELYYAKIMDGNILFNKHAADLFYASNFEFYIGGQNDLSLIWWDKIVENTTQKIIDSVRFDSNGEMLEKEFFLREENLDLNNYLFVDFSAF